MEQISSLVHVTVILQFRVPAVQVVLEREGAPDSVHRQSADLPVVLQRRVSHSACCAEDRRDPSSAVLGDPSPLTLENLDIISTSPLYLAALDASVNGGFLEGFRHFLCVGELGSCDHAATSLSSSQ